MGREVKRVAANTKFSCTGKNPRMRKGDWYQMWQTVSDEPYTPAFETPEELAKHCAHNPWGAEKDMPVSYENWLKFINGPGWCLSGGAIGGRFMSGVELALEMDK